MADMATKAHIKRPISNTMPFKSFSSIYIHTNSRTTERHSIRRKLKQFICIELVNTIRAYKSQIFHVRIPNTSTVLSFLGDWRSSALCANHIAHSWRKVLMINKQTQKKNQKKQTKKNRTSSSKPLRKKIKKIKNKNPACHIGVIIMR